MSVFLAWCRGKVVETPDGRRWVAHVKVDAERRPGQAWIVLRPQCDGATVSGATVKVMRRSDGGVVPAGHTFEVNAAAFEEALQMGREQMARKVRFLVAQDEGRRS
jgi:hypothetical protein